MDPIDRLGDRVRRGVRLSMRCLTPEGASDVIGMVLEVGAEVIRLEDRHAREFEVPRAGVRSARLVPTIARGRNPDRDRPQVALAPDEYAEAIRLCEVLTEIDFTPVYAAGSSTATLGDSRADLRGEWVVLHLHDEEHFGPLASWAARRNARNALVVRPQ